ncbi:hypothetical protein DBW_2239 [Desulfuromonas sp. DDH964]|nr:hypothetical protein DBW_2239 [Desulfuromonas sp. DDH964]
MICGFCGREIPDRLPQPEDRCGACPGGCRKVHCPHCGYANPSVPAFLQKLTRSRAKGEKEDS